MVWSTRVRRQIAQARHVERVGEGHISASPIVDGRQGHGHGGAGDDEWRYGLDGDEQVASTSGTHVSPHSSSSRPSARRRVVSNERTHGRRAQLTACAVRGDEEQVWWRCAEKCVGGEEVAVKYAKRKRENATCRERLRHLFRPYVLPISVLIS